MYIGDCFFDDRCRIIATGKGLLVAPYLLYRMLTRSESSIATSLWQALSSRSCSDMGASGTVGLRSCGGDGLSFDVLAGWMAHGEFSGKIGLNEDRQSNCIFEIKDPTEAQQQVKEKAGPKTNRTFEIPLSFFISAWIRPLQFINHASAHRVGGTINRSFIPSGWLRRASPSRPRRPAEHRPQQL